MASSDPYASSPGQETTNTEKGERGGGGGQSDQPSEEVVNMDELLAKLRLEMAELSLQGDDFARQMCHMYAIFEEVLIGGSNSGKQQAVLAQPLSQNPTPALARSSEPTRASDEKLEFWAQPSTSPGGNVGQNASAFGSLQQRAILPLPPLKPLKASDAESGYQEDVLTASQRQVLRATALYGSPGVRRKRMNIAPPQRPPRSRDPGRKKGEEKTRNHRRSKSEPNCNPLLETISALDYDPGDSDDSFETPPTAVTSATQDQDRESVGYAGSNSVDSGYKSLCPTPEIPESSYYGGEPILPPPTVCGLTGRRLPPVTQRKGLSSVSHHQGSDVGSNRALDSKLKSGAQTSPNVSRRSPNVVPQKAGSAGGNYSGGANDSSSSSSSPNHRGIDPKPKMGTKAVDFQKHPAMETLPFRLATSNARTEFFQAEKDGSRFETGQMVATRPRGSLTNYYDTASVQSGSVGSRNAPLAGRTEYYDVDLDHLMHLRRTLITAIQKCEASMNASISAQKDNLAGNRTSQCSATGQIGSQSPQISRASLQQRPRRRSRSISSEMRPKRKESDNSDFTTSGSGDGDSPSSQKSVRFDTDSYFYARNSSKNLSVKYHSSQCSDSGCGYVGSKQVAYAKGSKSILKDPLCAGIRSRLSEGATDNVASTDSTFEEEIDALLYGKAEYYDLESVKEFPCSYVTMIEEKYRGGKSSVAKVKRLKEPNGSVNKPTSLNLESGGYNGSQVLQGSRQTVQAQVHSPEETKANSTSSSSGKSKNRFTEVARCMLEILEDIQFRKVANVNCRPSKSSGLKLSSNCGQRKNGGNGVSAASSSAFNGSIPVSGRIQETKIDTVSSPGGGGTFPRRYKSKNQKLKTDHILVAGGAQGHSLVYTKAAEYHVYEEIVYDSIAGMSQLDLSGPNPPPLPARPDGMFHKQRRMSVSDLRHDIDYHGHYDPDGFSQPRLRDDTDFVYAQASTRGSSVSGNASYATGRSVGAFRSHTYSGNKPKQRSNLYSLFADQLERRNLSQSLEREQRSTNIKDADIDPTAIIEDDYGFRKRCLYPSSNRKHSN